MVFVGHCPLLHMPRTGLVSLTKFVNRQKSEWTKNSKLLWWFKLLLMTDTYVHSQKHKYEVELRI